MLPHRLPYLPYNKTFTVEKMTVAGKPRFDAENYVRYTDRILQVLADGPFTAAEVAVRLCEPQRRVAWFLGEMTRTGHAHIYAISAQRVCCRYRKRPLYAAGPNADKRLSPPLPKKTSGENIGVDADDLAWMAYWRARWERRKQSSGLVKLERAA
jgi:hypothetical protein